MGFFDVLLLPRVWVSAAFCLTGLVLLVRFRVTHNLRLVFLSLAFLVFGTAFLLPLGKFADGMGLHPSPMCVMTKPFLFLDAGRAVPIVFISLFVSFAVLTVVGNKLFCGWACPVGAIQEICHRVPLPKGMKVKLPFGATNWMRVVIFLAYVVLVLAAGVGIYDYMNPFEFLHWGFQPLVVAVFSLTLLAGLFVFRPFCYLVCPLGLATWLLEHIAITKVRLDKNKCTSCNICVNMSPCPAVKPILDGKRSRPDCHACGRCIEVCPERALAFKP